MITFETSVRIKRRIDEVFSYVSDPLKFPRWNSAVGAVRKTSPGANGVASTYSMERELPSGRAINQLEVVANEAPREFAIRATAGPTPFVYRYSFRSENGETVVELDGVVELSGVAAFLPQVARRTIKSGVDENLAMLKRILETTIADSSGGAGLASAAEAGTADENWWWHRQVDSAARPDSSTRRSPKGKNSQALP